MKYRKNQHLSNLLWSIVPLYAGRAAEKCIVCLLAYLTGYMHSSNHTQHIGWLTDIPNE